MLQIHRRGGTGLESNSGKWVDANAATTVNRERTTKLNTDYVTIYVRNSIFCHPFHRIIRMASLGCCVCVCARLLCPKTRDMDHVTSNLRTQDDTKSFYLPNF